MEINQLDWHVTPFRADRWMETWIPACERALSFGAKSATITRSIEDPLHFTLTTAWENREDFDRYWSSDEISAAREDTITLYLKPLLPTWHTPITGF